MPQDNSEKLAHEALYDKMDTLVDQGDVEGIVALKEKAETEKAGDDMLDIAFGQFIDSGAPHNAEQLLSALFTGGSDQVDVNHKRRLGDKYLELGDIDAAARIGESMPECFDKKAFLEDLEKARAK